MWISGSGIPTHGWRRSRLRLAWTSFDRGAGFALMFSNPLAAWFATLVENATIWEAIAALLGVASIGYAAFGIVDNIFDLRYVKRSGEVGGPRWIAAALLLLANVWFLCQWFGYTHVALTAAYLPARDDVATSTLSEVAVMRILYGLFGLLGQATLRWMRTWLRGLSREQWEPLFGEAARWEARALSAEGRMHAQASEIHQHRAEKHAMGNRAARAELRVSMLERLLARSGIEVPPILTGQAEEPSS